MPHTADRALVHDYTSLDGESTAKTASKQSKAYGAAFSLTLGLGVVYFVATGCLGWGQQQVNLQTQAGYVAEQMDKFMTDPKQVDSSKQPKGAAAADAAAPKQADTQAMSRIETQMKELMADPKFVEWQKRFAAQMKAVAAAAPLGQNLTQGMSDPIVQDKMKHFTEQVKELMAEPDFVEWQKRAAVQMKAVMADPVVQEKTKHFTEQMKTALANSHARKQVQLGRRLLSSAKPSKLSRPPAVSRPAGVAAPQPLTAMRGSSVVARAEPAKPKYTPLLSVLGEKKIATSLGKAGLLTGAEKSGTFSKLEKSGLFSTAESLLPLADQFGIPQFLQGAIDSPGGLAPTGAVLVALGPIFAASEYAGLLPKDLAEAPLVFAPGLLFTGTTAVGVAFLLLSSVLAELQQGPASQAKSPTPLLTNVGKAKLATVLSQAEVLSGLEKDGVFSQLEEAGAFSTAEKLLPTVDSLGLLPFLQDAIDKPGDLALSGALLVALVPLYAVAGGSIPDPQGPLAVVPPLILTGTTLTGATLLILSSLIPKVKNPEQLEEGVRWLAFNVRDPLGALLLPLFLPAEAVSSAVDGLGKELGVTKFQARSALVTAGLGASGLATAAITAGLLLKQ